MFRDTNRGKIVEKSWKVPELRKSTLPAHPKMRVCGKRCPRQDTAAPNLPISGPSDSL